MLMLPPTVRVYVATGTTDLRRSIDGLSMLVRDRLALDPLSGHRFLFRNRLGDRVKILAWDRSGFWVLYKRLERGTFAWPTETDATPSRCGAPICSCCSRVRVIETVRPKYACPHCHDGVSQAPAPPQAVERSLATEGLLAHIVVSKYVDHLPLYRLERIFDREHLDLSRATLCGWVADVATALAPIGDELRRQIVAATYLQTDDTPVTIRGNGQRQRSDLHLSRSDRAAGPL
jgi:transposase